MGGGCWRDAEGAFWSAEEGNNHGSNRRREGEVGSEDFGEEITEETEGRREDRRKKSHRRERYLLEAIIDRC
jgi:hypothetical protein